MTWRRVRHLAFRVICAGGIFYVWEKRDFNLPMKRCRGGLSIVQDLLSPALFRSVDCCRFGGRWELLGEFAVLGSCHGEELRALVNLRVPCGELVTQMCDFGLELSNQGRLVTVTRRLLRRWTRLLRCGVTIDINEPATVDLIRLQETSLDFVSDG